MNTLRPPSAEAGHQKSINRFLKSIKGLYRVIRAKISRSPDVPAPSSAIWPFVPVVKITNSGRVVSKTKITIFFPQPSRRLNLSTMDQSGH